MHKATIALASLAAIVAVTLIPTNNVCAELTRVTIGANPAGTVFNIIGGGFAKVIQENMGVPSIVRPYSGSSVYLPFLHQGTITLGINSSIDSVLSYTGQEPFRAAMTNIRALIAAYPVGYMYWVRASSDLYRIEDLEGSRVVINYRGLVGLDRLNRAILATGGLSEDDVRSLTAAGLPEGTRLVLEGRADAVPMSYQIPLVQQAHASLPGGLRFLLMGQNEARLVELMPGTRVATAQPSVNTVGIYEPIRTASYDAYLNAGTHISEEDAYRLVKTLHEHWVELQNDYVVLRSTMADEIAPANNPHPYHSGAIIYFKEIGLWTEAHEENHRRFGL